MNKPNNDAEPSLASAGSHNTHMATARLLAANTWLQDEIRRLRLTAEEREAIEQAVEFIDENSCWQPKALRGLLERLG